MEGAGKITLGILSVLVLMNFADGAIDSWAYDGGTAAATQTFAKSLAEDATTIVTVLATTDTGSATVDHTIGTQPNTGQFEIAGATGVITLGTGMTLDYESDQSLVIEVVATEDAGSPAPSATATITLTITDVNEHTPVFTTPSATPVSIAANEAGAVGSTVYTVAATDDDTGETITYSIASGDTNSDFAIGASTGVITIAKTLVRSTTPTYALVVHATDNGATPKSAVATINVVVWNFPSGNGSGNVKASMFALVLAAVCALAKLM